MRSRRDGAGIKRGLKMSKPEHGASFDRSSAVLSAVSAVPNEAPRSPQELPPAALAVAEKPYGAAYSPIVLAGLVRLIEFGLVMAVGLAVYLAYVVRAVVPGRYVYPPATAEDMYHPARYGRTAFGDLEVRAK